MGRASKRKKWEDESSKPRMKKQRRSPTNTSLLPPCKVCQEPAAGFHYGANTCEACKGFFRRSLVREGDHECVNGDEKCPVVFAGLKGRKRICSRCRHLKCLAVGMSLQAVKTGRYTHAKRTQDILEYKQVMGIKAEDVNVPFLKSVVTATVTVADTAGTTTVTVADTAGTTTVAVADTAGTTTVAVADTAGTTTVAVADTAGATTLATADAPAVISTPPDTNSSGSASSCQSSAGGLGPGLMLVPVPPPQEYGPAIQCAMTLQPVELSRVQNSSAFWSLSDHVKSGQCVWDPSVGFCSSPSRPQSSWSSSSVLDSVNAMDHVESGVLDNAVVPGSSRGSPFSSSSVSLWDNSFTSPSADIVVGSSGGGGDMSDEECQRLTEHILQSYVDSNFTRYTLTAEEILEKQREYCEKVQAKLEVFGPMENLSEEEYLEFYRTTGMELDNRRSFFSSVSKVMEQNIRDFIRFVKTMPGFSELCMKDKMTLIKDNRAEVMAIAQATGYNHELQVYTMPSGRTVSVQDMAWIGGQTQQRARGQCVHTIQSLGLSLQERVLFKCVVLFTLGKNDVEEPERVSAIQWRMVQCLRWLLRQSRRPKPDIILARIVAVFGRMREFAAIFSDWMSSKSFAQFVRSNRSTLLDEWFSNI